MSKHKEKLKNEKESYSTGKLKQTGRATGSYLTPGLYKKGKLKPRMVSPSDMILRKNRKSKKKLLKKTPVEKLALGGVATVAKAASKIRKARLKKSAEEAKKVREKGKAYDKKVRKKNIESAKQGARPKSERRLKRSSQVIRRNKELKTPQGNLREPFEEEALSFSLGGIVTSVAKAMKKKSSLRDDYKPKLKNEKEVYSNNLKFAKQDYSDTIKNYHKTQKRKKRNRAGLVAGGAAAAAAIQSRKDKQNKK